MDTLEFKNLMRIPRQAPFKILTILTFLLLLSCAYSFHGTLPENIKSVQIEQFRSSVTEYGLEQEITSLVTEAIVRDGRLFIDNETPDTQITGTIASFSKTAVTYTGGEDVEQYKLELRLSVSMDNTANNEYIIHNETVSEWLLYNPAQETFDSAKQRLIIEVADTVVRRCLSGW